MQNVGLKVISGIALLIDLSFLIPALRYIGLWIFDTTYLLGNMIAFGIEVFVAIEMGKVLLGKQAKYKTTAFILLAILFLFYKARPFAQ
jgi:hypothetical protein